MGRNGGELEPSFGFVNGNANGRSGWKQLLEAGNRDAIGARAARGTCAWTEVAAARPIKQVTSSRGAKLASGSQLGNGAAEASRRAIGGIARPEEAIILITFAQASDERREPEEPGHCDSALETLVARW